MTERLVVSMFVEILHFPCLLIALSPVEWRDLHMLSSSVRRIICYCDMHPPIPPMVNTSRSLSTIGFFGGVAVCEALRTTCRRSFCEIQRLYAWYSWIHDDLYDRFLHFHQYCDFVARLLRVSSRIVDAYNLAFELQSAFSREPRALYTDHRLHDSGPPIILM